MTDAAALFALLPQPARDALTLAVAALARWNAGDRTGYDDMRVQTDKAMAAAGIPPKTPGTAFPLASSYDEVQHAALAWSAIHELAPGRFACPGPPRTLRRWLGIDPPGLLETTMIDGEPLWRALQLAPDDIGRAEVLDALPVEQALRVLVELSGTGIGYGIAVPAHLRLLDTIGDEARAWAIAQADAFPTEGHYRGSYLKQYIFIALARAKVPIAPRWEHLYPNVMCAGAALLVECARALPDDRRAAVLAEHFSSMRWAVEVATELGTADVFRALLGSAEPHSVRWKWLVEQMRELGKKNDVARDAVEEVVAATPPPIALYVTSSAKPKSAADLTELAKEQLRIAGRGYDQRDLDASARLTKNGEETSFHGFFETRTVADAEGQPLYDVLLYMVDAGSIFKTGTTEVVGALSQGGVVLETKNDALRIALQAAVAKNPPKMRGKPKPKAKPKAEAKPKAGAKPKPKGKPKP